jgi:RNA polymerase subunit RPABC4/transcription elongation factor Spt4
MAEEKLKNRFGLCGRCGALIEPGREYCDNCARAIQLERNAPPPVIAPPEPQFRVCERCGMHIKPGRVYCEICARLIEMEQDEEAVKQLSLDISNTLGSENISYTFDREADKRSKRIVLFIYGFAVLGILVTLLLFSTNVIGFMTFVQLGVILACLAVYASFMRRASRLPRSILLARRMMSIRRYRGRAIIALTVFIVYVLLRIFLYIYVRYQLNYFR